jgi:hypothetical protein
MEPPPGIDRASGGRHDAMRLAGAGLHCCDRPAVAADFVGAI